MAEVRKAPPAEEVRGGCWLFVEGHRTKGLDGLVLKELFAGLPIRVEALGPSFHVRSAAEALHPSHPRYYFLIDRDYRYDFNGVRDWEALVERTWRGFPDPEQSNLLIWRRRELESYFLLPDYLARSRHLTNCTPDELARRITDICAGRAYLDAANLVISVLREELRENWVEHFGSVDGFGSADEALARLLSREEIRSRGAEVSETLRADRIEMVFRGFMAAMLDGCDRPVVGRGRWLEMVRASKVLPEVVNSCFRVERLQGPQRLRAVLKDLLRRDLSEQPEDFQELYRLMKAQVDKRA